MEIINSKNIKRDCFIALLLPVALLSLVQSALNDAWSSKIIIFMAISGLILFSYYLYQFFIRLENLLWQEHLISVVKKISTPVLIADQTHDIVFMNDSFYRIPFLSSVLKYEKLSELLPVKSFSDLLEKLTYKIKISCKIQDHDYQWVLIPVYSPLGKRWGTLVECVSSEKSKEILSTTVESFPFVNVIDQLPMPVMIIDDNERVLYVNLSLKLLLIRHKGLIGSICPTWDLYDPTGDTLNHFMKLANVKEESFRSLLHSGNGAIQLQEECYHLIVQNISGEKNRCLGTLVLWQEKQTMFDPILDHS